MKTRTFELYWKHGEVTTVKATDTGDTYQTLANAVNNAGIGAGALPALDYWRELPAGEPAKEGIT